MGFVTSCVVVLVVVVVTIITILFSRGFVPYRFVGVRPDDEDDSLPPRNQMTDTPEAVLI